MSTSHVKTQLQLQCNLNVSTLLALHINNIKEYINRRQNWIAPPILMCQYAICNMWHYVPICNMCQYVGVYLQCISDLCWMPTDLSTFGRDLATIETLFLTIFQWNCVWSKNSFNFLCAKTGEKNLPLNPPWMIHGVRNIDFQQKEFFERWMMCGLGCPR